MKPFEELLRRVSDGNKKISLSGLLGSSKAYLVSRLILEGPKRTYVYLAPTSNEATRFQKDIDFFLGAYGQGEVYYFPSYDVLPFAALSPHTHILCERIKTLFALNDKKPPYFVSTTFAATLTHLPPHDLLNKPFLLAPGAEVERGRLIRTLSEWGYQNVPLVLDRGNIAVRGSLIDLYGPLDPHPVRIEWSGDLIESIREFEPKAQRTLPNHPPRSEVALVPVREVVLREETIQAFSKKMRSLCEERDVPRSLWGPLIDKVKARIPFAGIETYLPLFYEAPTSFWDWLPENTVLIIDDFEKVPAIVEEHLSDLKGLITEGQRILDIPDVTLPPKLFQEKISHIPSIEFDSRSDTLHFETESQDGIRREIEASRKGAEPLAPLARRIKEGLLTDEVLLISSTLPQAKRLSDLLAPYFPHPPSLSDSGFSEQDRARGSLKILPGGLSQGFRLPSEGITLITEEEIFGQKVRKRTKETFRGEGLSSFADLKIGDAIVHKDHGIGNYLGLKGMEIDHYQGDFLEIEYRGGDKLYLPVYRMNLVQRYVGGEDGAPRIDRLGGTSWLKLKGKSEKAIRELAGELLNLYAARSVGEGFSFSPPNELFEAFEAGFPYEETPDQEQAISDVLKDMQKPVPMDRLVLGDVGYGKTEVALRAAFKAALDGKQTAFLVPTTLLAFQHHERFLERFRDYPVRIEMVSRFRSVAQQRQILKGTAEGKIDILIGTHRLLQPDVSFKDLGLLVIDEEHRFGVDHKEKVKRLRKNVDVLTLSATPIPRTLYLSLVGVRGISVIETPPTDRLSIRTFVTPFDEIIVREAILRELKRGGQAFFVHNEVQSMERMKETLQRLVPEANIGIGHGQMDEAELEEAMIQFYHQEFNLLLCTTIIESGIDIPTANTILIHQAEGFGLAQIYQLRGRVGRGKERAYAYLLVSPDKAMTAEAKKRMGILQRFSELGSGYRMASYDLEIRGAGNMLGTEQSGHMTAIGYELYTELLEEAVHELQGKKVLDEIEPELHFPLSAFLPTDYIPDPPVRLEMYRRLSSLEEEQEIDPIRGELVDRFGEPPPETENLLTLSVLKVFAKKLRIKQVRYDGRRFLYAFDPSSPLSPDLLTQKIKKEPKRYRLTPDFRLTVQHPLNKNDKKALPVEESCRFLRELSLHI